MRTKDNGKGTPLSLIFAKLIHAELILENIRKKIKIRQIPP